MPEETQRIDPYEAVIADLRAKRDQIDQAIASLEVFRFGIGAAVPAPVFSGSIPSGEPNRSSVQNVENGPGALLGMSIADATKKLLANKRATLKNPEIAVLFKDGGLMLNSKDWTNTIGAVLTRRANEVGDIVKIGRGTWGLKEWYPNRSFKKDKETAKGADVTEAETSV